MVGCNIESQSSSCSQERSKRLQPMHALAGMHADTCENISVAVRMRDVHPAEQPAWQILSGNELALLDECDIKESTKQALGHLKQGGKQSVRGRFSFDAVFNAKSSTRDVYRPTVQPIVHSALDGVNGCVLAFGGTGSGKTYTMVGDDIVTSGVVTLAVGDIFAEAGKRSSTQDVTLAATMVELYDEQIVDLFAAPRAGPESTYRPNIQIVVRRSCEWTLAPLYSENSCLSGVLPTTLCCTEGTDCLG